jgi:spore coat polysaccharide biosynthesis protein SpsF (cytidylyltransferase family)
MRQATAMIQARMGSTRLPGKVLKALAGRPMLWHIVQRVGAVRGVGNVVVLTSERLEDQPIRDFCENEGISVFGGSERDVLDRFYQAAIRYGSDPVIRITGDCPLVDPELIERVILLFASGEWDHVSVATGAGALYLNEGRFPDGLDAECFSFASLARAWREATAASDREHVTPFIWRTPGRFRCRLVHADQDFSHLRWTVDHEEDFRMITSVYEALYREGRHFVFREVIELLESRPDLAFINRARIGGEGYAAVWHPDEPKGNQR